MPRGNRPGSSMRPERIARFQVVGIARPCSASPDIGSTASEVFQTSKGAEMATNHPVFKAALTCLAERRPRGLELQRALCRDPRSHGRDGDRATGPRRPCARIRRAPGSPRRPGRTHRVASGERPKPSDPLSQSAGMSRKRSPRSRKSPRTVKRSSARARAWLGRALAESRP